MAKPQAIKINNFYGGISDSPRKQTVNEFSISKHFDIFSDPQKLTPYRSLETDTNDGSTATGMKQYNVLDFLYASTSSRIYGLGRTTGGLTKIVYKSDITVSTWTLPDSSEGNGAVKNGCFVEYKDYMWGFQGNNQLWKWGTLSGTPSMTNSVTTVGATITSVANGVIAADANLYLAYNNVLVRIAPGLTVTDNAKTVPSNYKITSLANYGNYLAIGCAPIQSYNGTSKVFIWNLASDLFTETLDFGEGDLRVIETIEGQIIGITDRYLNNTVGAGKGSMIIQGYAGGSPQVLKEVFTSKLTGITIPTSKATKNNRLFFAAKIMTNTTGTEYNEGIWSFGRKNAQYPYSLTLDVIDENVSISGIQSFGLAGNFFFIAHSADGSIDKTDDTATYSFTSIYESQIFDLGDVSTTKRLNQFSILTAPILSGGSVTCKYKMDDDTSWTTIGTLSTVGEVGRDFYGIESTGEDFATFGEIKFRLESTGGAEITGFKFITEDLVGSIG
jgi:hypothetical protein